MPIKRNKFKTGYKMKKDAIWIIKREQKRTDLIKH